LLEKNVIMSVRKRIWRNRDNSQGEAWVVAYTDQAGKRRIKSFDRKRDAAAYHGIVSTDLHAGTHVPDSQSVTVGDAGRLWLKSCEAAGLERSTMDQYRQHLTLHIVPLIGAVKLSRLTTPMARNFENTLKLDRSPAMVRKVRGSLSAILADAQESGLVGQNVVRNLRARRQRGKEARADKRQKGKLKIGVDIPAPHEVRSIVGALTGRWRPLILTAIFTGLRASELRGLCWADVDLKRGELHVRQRADCFNAIGRPKSEAGERVVPLPPSLVTVLREHRLAWRQGKLDLVFPNSVGNVDTHFDIVSRGFQPAQIAAGVVTESGKAKYPGLHSLRHFYASWCINRRIDGGLELPLKLVQARLGHASITMTADCYGHLFPRGDDGAELDAAAQALLGIAL
jgi:integrase